MKKQQLYIKNDKGRYVPYEPPKVNVSETLFLKVGNKYVPYGRRLKSSCIFNSTTASSNVET